MKPVRVVAERTLLMCFTEQAIHLDHVLAVVGLCVHSRQQQHQQ
jgi:hypothetical protein